MLGEVVVAAINRDYHFAVVPKRLLQRAAGTDRSVFECEADVGLVLTADLGEELIQVVDDANLLVHLGSPKRKIRNPNFEIRNKLSQINSQIGKSKTSNLNGVRLEHCIRSHHFEFV